MKDGLIHVVFVIDESGSMYGSINDVIGGFNKTIKEQKGIKDGECIVSLYKFGSTVTEVYKGKKLDEIDDLKYSPGGMTKLYDALGTSIDNIGKWLNDMKEEDRPSKNMFVVITDGEENYSTEYSLDDVKKRIKHQEEKYNWSFIYLGNDLTNANDANDLGFKYKGFTTKSKFYNNYDVISTGVTAYRCAVDSVSASLALDESVAKSMTTLNEEYKADTGIDIDGDSTSVSTTDAASVINSIDLDEFKKKFDYNQWE